MTAFDSLASSYDDDFTHSIIGEHLRNRVHRRLLDLWQTGDHILELGCGTGEDALFLASQGITVTATDSSENMLQITRAKTHKLEQVNIHPLDLNHLPHDKLTHAYDGVFSNFGALNCVIDMSAFSDWLASRVQVGGTLAFAVMSPFCLWETFWHGINLDISTATRRWHNRTLFTVNNISIPIYYPTIRHITRDFAPHFQRTRVMPLGLFLPPSDVYPVIEKRPTLLKWLTRADNATAQITQFALFADHYWIEFRRI